MGRKVRLRTAFGAKRGNSVPEIAVPRRAAIPAGFAAVFPASGGDAWVVRKQGG
jgi:hypothetical protein